MKNKIIIIMCITISLLIVLLNLVSAEYMNICLLDGQSINIDSQTYSSTSPGGTLICGGGKCTAHLISGIGSMMVCVNKVGEDLYGVPGLPSNCLGRCVYLNQTIIKPSLTLTTHWPFANNSYFNKQNFYLDIDTNEISSISLIDNLAGKETLLCANCNTYSMSRFFTLGANDITIRAVKGLEIQQSEIKFIVDNKNPIISKTYPLANGFIGSTFSISYSEDNLKNITLNYGVPGNYKSKSLQGCQSGANQNCSIDVTLPEFDGQKIEYWFNVLDKAGNSMDSSHISVFVDESAPIINYFNISMAGMYVNFNMSITEPNLNKVEYQDNALAWKTLCPSLINGVCQKKISFPDGSHNISITISDKAGHIVFRNTTLFIDTKKPMISSSSPASGAFSSGEFLVKYTEANVIPLGVGLYIAEPCGNINIKTCPSQSAWKNCPSGISQQCSFDAASTLNISQYNGKIIYYWFEINDVAGNKVQSAAIKTNIDTVSPKINNINYTKSGNYFTISINITEQNFLKAQYTDSLNPTSTKSLCTYLSKGICKSTIYLSPGTTHNLAIEVLDKAGNSALQSLSISN